MVLYPCSGFGGKIFVLRSIRLNQKSIEIRFLQFVGLTYHSDWPMFRHHIAEVMGGKWARYNNTVTIFKNPILKLDMFMSGEIFK